ncbi:MAG: 1-acyl-sn-glycerol-3-phosphate acyltransferase [Chloroflexi bacterium]|nr:1-acyl-sn-glycerol-3-phosphate acyltransferase [Chloroflexota bacterium]
MNKQEYHPSVLLKLQRRVLNTAARLIFLLGGRVKISGLENIPRGQVYVVAANHISIFDPPLILSFWPESLEAIGATDMFRRPGFGQLLKMFGAVPVHRGEYDRELLETILTMLRSGYRLLIAPEGGRSHTVAMRRAKPGIAYILDEANAPVIPVGIVGTTDDLLKKGLRFQRPEVEIRIGKPIRLPLLEGRGEERREARQRNADLIMSHIAGLLPSEYRGVYADSAIFPV